MVKHPSSYSIKLFVFISTYFGHKLMPFTIFFQTIIRISIKSLVLIIGNNCHFLIYRAIIFKHSYICRKCVYSMIISGYLITNRIYCAIFRNRPLNFLTPQIHFITSFYKFNLVIFTNRIAHIY